VPEPAHEAQAHDLVTGALDTWSRTIGGAAPELGQAGQGLAAAGLVLGLVLWFTGGKILKTGVVLSGLLAGACFGYLALPGIGADETFGYEAPYAGLACGAIIGMLGAVLLYRFAMVIAGVASFGVAGLLGGLLYLKHAPAPEPDASASASEYDSLLDSGSRAPAHADAGGYRHSQAIAIDDLTDPVEEYPRMPPGAIDGSRYASADAAQGDAWDEADPDALRTLAMHEQPRDTLNGANGHEGEHRGSEFEDDPDELEMARIMARKRAGEIMDKSAARVRAFLREASAATREAFEELEPKQRQTIALGALGGAGAGLLIGLLRPRKSAAMLTSLVGSALIISSGMWLANSLDFEVPYLQSASVTGWGTTWLILTLAGWVVQLSRMVSSQPKT